MPYADQYLPARQAHLRNVVITGGAQVKPFYLKIGSPDFNKFTKKTLDLSYFSTISNLPEISGGFIGFLQKLS